MATQNLRLLFATCLAATLTICCGQDEAEPDFCSAFSVLTEVTKEEKQVESVATILDDVSPGLSEVLKLSLVRNNMMAEGNDSNSSTPTIPPLQVAYNTLAQNFSARPSVSGYNNFVEAVNEISLAQAEACSDPSFVPTIEVVQRLAEQFDNATTDSGRDLSKARSAFGKLLCLNTRAGDLSEVGARRKRQSGCKQEDRVCSGDAMREGLGKVNSVCEFFTCLRAMVLDDFTSRIGPVFGFEAATDTKEECLAFVIDTTGSMGPAIAAAKQIILSFLASEASVNELQCYILVPFNDYDHVDPALPDYGPITVVSKREVGDFRNFVTAVNELEPDGGGDGPEYALTGMLASLRATTDKGVRLMTPGSQMVVLTDALAKDPQFETEVIEEAERLQVCVHFLIASPFGLLDGLYQRIADGSSGILLEFSEFTFANFVATYQQNPCNRLNTSPAKRSVSRRSTVRSKRGGVLTPDSSCKDFYISSFAFLLKLSVEADTSSIVSITRPNGTIAQVIASGNLAVFSEAMPSGGQWRVCVDFGTLEISVSQEIAFDTSILFINEGSQMPSMTPPPLCTSSRIALLSSQAANISYVSLNLISSETGSARRINLIKCKRSGLFVSDVITFSEGTYTVRLSGHDIHGVSFTQDTRHTLVFDSSSTVDYELTSVREDTIEMDRNSSLAFSFRLHNPSVYSTSFRFASTSVRGFNKRVVPISAVVPAKESVEIMFTIRVDSQLGELVKVGSSYKFTLFTSNGCVSYSISKTVMVTG